MHVIRVKFRSIPEKDAPMSDFEVIDPTARKLRSWALRSQQQQHED